MLISSYFSTKMLRTKKMNFDHYWDSGDFASIVCLKFLSMGIAALVFNRIVVVGSKFCPLHHGSSTLFLLVPMVQWHHVHR